MQREEEVPLLHTPVGQKEHPYVKNEIEQERSHCCVSSSRGGVCAVAGGYLAFEPEEVVFISAPITVQQGEILNLCGPVLTTVQHIVFPPRTQRSPPPPPPALGRPLCCGLPGMAPQIHWAKGKEIFVPLLVSGATLISSGNGNTPFLGWFKARRTKYVCM